MVSCQDSTAYFKYLFLFKQTVTASSNIPLLKATDKNYKIYILAIKNKTFFLFFTTLQFLVQVKKVPAQYKQIYVIIFQKLAYFYYQIKQPAALPPFFVKVVEIIKKTQIFQCFTQWYALLVFQTCCGTDLRETSHVNLK